MKDQTPILIICALVLSMAIATIAANRAEKAGGGSPAWIWKQNTKELVTKP